MQDLVRRLYHINDRVTGYTAFVAPLLTRILVGYTFYFTGYGKTHNPDVHANLVELMRTSHIPNPELNAWFVGYLEWIGSLLLGVGFLTRPVAAMLMVSMGVAVATADAGDLLKAFSPTSDKQPTDIASFVLFCLLAWLVWYGAGALSVDKLFGHYLRQWSAPHDDPD